MFLHVSVSHSVHRGGGGVCAIPACLSAGGVVSQHALQVVSQHALQWGGAIPACIADGIPACLAAGGSAPGGSAPRGPAPGGGLLPGSMPAPGRCLLPRGVETLPKADGYCCGRYASYWNAFLF